ncbi:uncharacterized protein LOC121837237 [Ixodes scapularis]|uniref:uncharacterized protein LOC121837237 n=1 Tax=Ixodes scapularis TaxID=6945 RepID=UPI001C382F5B|nr:uncharacterized protein LOC121837237 [Ixodes scapularis]
MLPDHLQDEWTGWCSELVELERVKIPRLCDDGLHGKVTNRSLHIFADASTAAYGAMLYLRTTYDTGATTTTLLLAKGRVAPLKTVMLARLELMAILIVSRLSKYVHTCLELEVKDVHFWTDSMITLYWIRGEASRWTLFVRNRVQEIESNCESATWHHCPGKENPADLMTRGLTASELVSSSLWWSGPSWLPLPATEWPKEMCGDLPRDPLEERGSRAEVFEVTVTPTPELIDISRFSSASNISRTTA